MFGMGGSEIIVILIVALLFLGPDKLPEVTKTISKGIRDLKKQSRVLQQTIENDEHIGGAIRDLKSALRGDEIPVRPPVRKPITEGETPPAPPVADAAATPPLADAATPAPAAEPKPTVTLPPTAGEPDPDVQAHEDHEDLAALIKPASGTIAQNAVTPDVPDGAAGTAKQKHG